MKIIVAVIIYDRIKNLEEWIRTWKVCEKENSELIIIHNYKNYEDKQVYQIFCEDNNIKYIPRPNIGMDIGALQDVFRGRLKGFPNEWDYLLWATDDILPMSKKFISMYMEEMRKINKGVVCLELSQESKLHIRTTGFIIDQLTASKITFPVDLILTKEQCWQFEHRNKNSFLEQINGVGEKVVQVHPYLSQSYLWDTHTRHNLNRWDEHYKEFPK